MMKRTVAIMLALFIAGSISLVGCGGSSASSKSDSPKDVVEQVSNLLIKGDLEKSLNFYDGVADEESKALVLGLMQMGMEATQGLKAFEILEETIAEDGTTAKVKVKYTYGDDTEKTTTENLVKTDSGWKVKVI